MADAPASLGDFFAKKKKKVPKASNLNNEAATTKPEEGTGKKKKDKNEDEWEEEQIVETTMQVSVAGRLRTQEEEKDDADEHKVAWGSAKVKKGQDLKDTRNLNEKKFPSLAKSVMGPSSNINIDDGSNANINIKTSKNVFAALNDDEDDDEAGPKRPTHIKPAMVAKKQGEFGKDAIRREVDKYSKKDVKKKKKDKKKNKDESDDEEEEEEDEEEEEVKENVKKVNKKKVKKNVNDTTEAAPEDEVELAEDVKIVPDESAARAKYIGRAKLDEVSLPLAELRAEKKHVAVSKKMQKFRDEEAEQDDKRLKYADWDDN